MSTCEYPVTLENVWKSYRGKRRQSVTALKDLSLSVEQGEILGVLGPNGAGKSTTIKLLTGQLRPDSGLIKVFGRSAEHHSIRENIGYLPENPAFYNFLTAREYLALVGGVFGMSGDDISSGSLRVLSLLDLEAAADRPIRQFSKGMVQRLGLAQTLLHDPDLFIFDEPMSGLDPIGRALVKNLMVELRARGKTVIFSTHVTADVEAVCDRVAVIVAGKLQSVAVVHDLLSKGIEGYQLQLTGCPQSVCEGFKYQLRANDALDVFVPCHQLNVFLAKIIEAGATILLMEPQRRNLEQFFLEIVEREGA